MESKSTNIFSVSLTLNEKEAIWLKVTMQNPLHRQEWEDESQTDKTMRGLFWNALNKEGVIIGG